MESESGLHLRVGGCSATGGATAFWVLMAFVGLAALRAGGRAR